MSLVEVTKDTRIFLKIAGAVGVLAVLIFLIFRGGQFLQTAFFPEPPAPAEEKFGALPPIEFPARNNQGFDYRIETISGFLPTFPLTITVYKLQKNEPTITALPDAKVRAANLGFTENEQALSTSEYKWTDPILNNSLFYEIYSYNFSVSPNYTNTQNFLPITGMRKEDALGTVSNFIKSLGGSTDDIDIEKSQYSYFTTSPEGAIPVSSPDIASLIRIMLFQKPVNDLEIYYPVENGSTLYFTLALLGRTPTVMEASYHHFTPTLSESSTYYLKTAQEAYDELKNGGGYIANPTEDKSIGVTEVTLGYYLNNNENQEYLLPVVVFSGINDFKAYVPAIRNQ